MRYIHTSGYKYTTAERCTLALSLFDGVTFGSQHFALASGRLTVREGYAWDGASGPTWDTNNALVPSLVHDVLYQAIRAGLLPESRRFDADLEFYRMMRERSRGFWSHIRAFYFFCGVRCFGWLSMRPKRGGEAQDNILLAL